MNTSEKVTLLRLYLDEADRLDGSPMYEKILLQARELKIHGATIFRAIGGYGIHQRIHSSKLLDLSQNLPIVIEIIDKDENIAGMLNYLHQIQFHGLTVKNEVTILS